VASRRSFFQESDSWAVFAETTWNAGEQFALTGGVRFTSESKDVHAVLIPVEVEGSIGDAFTRFITTLDPAFGGVGYSYFDETANRDESKVTPMLKAQYFINDDVMAYATVSKGFKGGGFNMALTNHTNQPFEFEEESSTTSELGVKTTLLDGAMHFNVALFNTSFEDLQVTSYDGFAFVVGNAAEATSRGLELDATWRVTESLTLGANYAWLDAQYDDFTGASCPVGSATALCGLSGETLVYAPENSANLNITYVMPLGASYELEFAGDINYTDDFYFQQDLDPEDSQEGFTKVNARVALNNIASDWRLALVGKNLTDELTSSYGLDQPILNGGAHVRNTMPPRTLALQFDVNF
jgi:outer membrane receptor protein involved in Fe transport